MSKVSRPVPQDGSGSRWRLALPWMVLALVLVMMVGLAWMGPSRLWAALSTGRSSGTASGPLQLTIAHTNDTWGYVYGCG